MTRETRTTIGPGDIKAVEIECTNCHYRTVRLAGSLWSQDFLSCPGGCGAVWMPYRDAVNNLNNIVFQLRNFSNITPSQGTKPPFIVRLEIDGDEKP